MVQFDKYKLLFLTTGILPYGVLSMFSQKMPDIIEKPIAHYARTITYTFHTNWQSSSSYQNNPKLPGAAFSNLCNQRIIDPLQFSWGFLWKDKQPHHSGCNHRCNFEFFYLQVYRTNALGFFWVAVGRFMFSNQMVRECFFTLILTN